MSSERSPKTSPNDPPETGAQATGEKESPEKTPQGDNSAQTQPADTAPTSDAAQPERTFLGPDLEWEVEDMGYLGAAASANQQESDTTENSQGTAAPADDRQRETPPAASDANGGQSENDTPLFPPWTQASPPKRQVPFFLHWEEQLWQFANGQAVQGAAIADSPGFCQVVYDFPEEEGPSVMRVSGDAKYAGVLGRKRAEEMGDLGPESRFQSYKIIKRSKQEADVLYHILPQSRLEQAKSACQAAPGCVLFDGVGLLLGLLRKAGKKAEQAVALHLETSVVLLVGNSQDIAVARRYPLLGTSHQELTTVVQTIDQDLRIAQDEQAVTLTDLQWIEALVRGEPPELPDTQVPIHPWPLVSFTLDGETVWTALPWLLHMADPRDGLLGQQERVLRPLELWEKWLRTGLLAAAVVLGGLAWTGTQVESRLETATDRKAQAVRDLEQELQGYSYTVEGQDKIQHLVDLVQELRLAGEAPSVGRIWNAFLTSRPSGWQIERVRFSFQDGAIEVRSSGVVGEDPRRAEQGMRLFREQVVRNGFTVTSSQLQLRAEQAQFSLHVRYPWGAGQ